MIKDLTLQQKIEYAVSYIKGIDLNGLECKTYNVNDYFYYNVCRYETHEKGGLFEAHKQFVDIQFIVEGQEEIDVQTPCDDLLVTPYDDSKDICFFGESLNYLQTILTKGAYIVLLPNHAHRGGINVDGVSKITKIVGKVKI